MSLAAARLREFQVAVMLLTRLPAGRIEGEAPTLASARWAFPLVGLLTGSIGWAAHAGAILLGGTPLLAAFCALAALILTTGALHQDGLADFADGIGAGRDRARRLAIMRDSRIGSYGVLALILSLGLWVAAIEQIGAGATLAFFWATGVLSRTGMAVLAAMLPPARADGLGALASGDTRGILATVAACLGASLLLLGLPGLWLALAAAIATALVGRMAMRGIGGQTGDVLGAAQALSETACCIAWALALA